MQLNEIRPYASSFQGPAAKQLAGLIADLAEYLKENWALLDLDLVRIKMDEIKTLRFEARKADERLILGGDQFAIGILLNAVLDYFQCSAIYKIRKDLGL